MTKVSHLPGAAILSVVLLLGCNRSSTPLPTPSPQYDAAVNHELRLVEVTEQSGVDFTFTSGHESGHHSILEWLGGGVAMLDYDQDGNTDLFFAGGGYFEKEAILGRPPALFRNFGHWRFEDVTSTALGDATGFYSHGCEVGDYDNDGFADVLVTGFGGLQLFFNQGDGTFTEIARDTGLVDDSWSTSAAWGDLNGDGTLDLYIAHYLNWSFQNHPLCHDKRGKFQDACGPKHFDALPDTVYYSNGDGTFLDVTSTAGFVHDGMGLGVVIADVDRDFDLDTYVANDTTENFLYLNNGDGQFEETALINGAAGDDSGAPNGSMGVDVGDFNGDGQFDLWVANYVEEPFALYRNMGGSLFQHVSRSTGINVLGGLYVGFGTGFADLDRDGDEDLVVANGHVFEHPATAPIHQLPLLLRNDDGRYTVLKFSPNSFFAEFSG